MISIQFGKAQGGYFNYLDSTSEWHLKGGGWNGVYVVSNYVTMYFDGDTIINGNNYYKLYEAHNDTFFTWPNHTFDTSVYGPFFMREDSSLKLYRTFNENIIEDTFDFQQFSSLQQGDFFSEPYSSCSVSNADTLYLGNRPLKRVQGQQFSFPFGVLEGVGYIGPLCGMGIEGNNYLVCYIKQNDTLSFNDSLNPYPINCNIFPIPNRLNHFTGLPCSASFTLQPDTTTPHNWFAFSTVTGAQPLTYNWNWGDGSSDSTPFPSHTYDSAGYYTICLTITDATNCISTFCDSSTYLYKTEATMVSINVIPTNVSELKAIDSSINILPNPANYILTVKSTSKQIKLTDLSGKTLIALQLNNGKAELDVSNLDNGIYFLQSDKGKTQKLIIQR